MEEMAKVDRNSSDELFGWDFQVNAAIILALENIESMNSVRVEGKTEDIEISLDTNERVYAQAKSIVKSSEDFRNVIAKLKEALRSLSDANKNGDAYKLIYVTNSPNPFGNQKIIGFVNL